MPKLTPGAKTTDLSAQVALMRQSPWGRVKAAVRYAIAGVTPDTWMSPNQPVAPVAQEAFGRTRDYPVGYNLFYTPRGQELTSFAQLRALSENCDLVRLAIETRKDQLSSMQWNIAHTDPKKDASNDPRVKALEAMLKMPDGIHDWDAWLRMLLEDVLVIDAATVLPIKLNSGAVTGFEVIDGALIKPLIDDKGRQPLPPSPAYQQNIKGLPAVDYTAAELIYKPRNPRSHKFYGYSPVEQILLTVNTAIRRSLSQLQYYTEGNIPAAFINVPDTWMPQQIQQFQDYWDTVIEGDQAYKRKVRFVPSGTSPKTLNEPPLKDEFDEWLARVVCYCFSLPPTAFVKQMNRSTSETQQDTAQNEGLAPLMGWVKRFMDFLIQVHCGAPDLQFQWLEQEVIDPAEQATVLTEYQKGGVYTINEIRAKLGEDPIKGDGGDDRLIITGATVTRLEDAIQPPPPPPTLGVDPLHPGEPPKPGAPVGKQPLKATPKDDATEKHVHNHLRKGALPALTPAETKLRDGFASALEVVRDAAVLAARRVEKASNTDDDRGSSYEHDAEDVAWWEGFADSLDTSGLSLVYDDYTDTLQAVSASGARETVARIVATDPDVQPAATGAGFDLLDHQDPNAIEWAHAHAGEMLSDNGQEGELSTATRDMVRRLIANALDEKVSNAEIARRLQDAYAFSPQRAELIARTEVINALGAGGLAGAKAVGMDEKSWLLSNDENKCARCIANAKQGWIPIGQAYVSGAQAPGQHPRCQCDQVYRKRPQED